MKRLTLLFVVVLSLGLSAPLSAQAAFGLGNFDVTFTEADGSPALRAGSHPFEMTTAFDFNTIEIGGKLFPDEAVKDVIVTTPAGFVGDVTAMPQCAGAEFIEISKTTNLPACSDGTAIGLISLETSSNEGAAYGTYPVYNLVPAPGEVNKFGFSGPAGNPVVIGVRLSQQPPYQPIARAINITQQVNFNASKLVIWGNPGDPAHDPYRGSCVNTDATATFGEVVSKGDCPASVSKRPFLTLPRSCKGPLLTSYAAASWQNPSTFVTGHSESTEGDPPTPAGTRGCEKLGFNPTISAKPTTKAASSPTGLDFSLDVEDEGLTNPSYEALAHADIEKAVVTLPEGFTTNPSVAEGLEVCSEAQFDGETVGSAPGAGCPDASKIGTVKVESPLIDESVDGSLYVATPYENKAGSLLSLYLVIKNRNLGIIVKQVLKVEFDALTGRITTVADDIPPLPFSHFKLHFREGTRSPLASPPGCGAYSADAVLTPSSGGAPITTSSLFEIITGPSEGPCPTGGTPPFQPGLAAGTLGNTAGQFSPFTLRLFRKDSDQEFTRFSIKLPPGLTGKLAGIPFCPDAAIAAAKARTGPHGGQEELDAPSCPPASQVGRTLVGAGVGPALAYAPGKVYLAGPYNGSPLSIAAITAARVGPFDLGTVVVRQALRISPETAEVSIDATGSDPIPHIIKGIPVHVRDIRVYVDRPSFMLNPTNCTRTSVASTVLGSGLDFGSAADDQPVTVTTPFQAADCGALDFAPRLALSLKGGTKRSATPRFKAVLTARPGDANIAKAQVTLPHSAFLEQGHIRTICTRVQFAQGDHPGEMCPAASVYGHARAITPLLSEPVEGPVFLRSSSNKLPDLVAALHNGQIDFNLVGRIDSVKKGRIRNTFESAPDVPVKSFTLEMQGGKKGLLVNSTNLCARKNRASVSFVGQNGKTHSFNPVVKPDCGKARKRQQKRAAVLRLVRTGW